MANDSLSIDVKFKDSQAVAGAKKVKVSIDDIKRADSGLNWDGMKKGGTAAEQSQGKFSALAVTIGNLASGAITGAITKCKELAQQVVEIGSGFETSMSKVAALSGASGDELGALEAKARELGASTTFSASQAADALGYMALAGWDTQQMLDGVGSALTLAQAGEMDLAAASDLLTDYLSAFNMQASDAARMSDVLAYAQANANTTVEGLGMAFKNCAANANAAGMDVETTSAAIAMMANQGLKGSEAGTALNAVLRDMTARMEDGAIAIGDQSIAVMDAQGNYRDFADILAEVEAATNGMGDAEKAAALQSTFTADSINGLNLLLNAGAGEMSNFRDELYNCAGTAEATAKTMTDNLGGDVAAMNSAFEELALKIYEGLQEPLRDAAQFVTDTAIPALTALVQNIDKVAPVLLGIGAGIAAVKAKGAIFDPLVKSAKSFTDGLIRCKTVTSAAGTTLVRYNTQTGKVTTQLYASAAAAKTHATQVKASEIAMKAGSIACRTLGTAMKAIAPVAAITIGVEIITHLASALSKAKERSEGMEAATRGLEAAATGATVKINEETGALESVGDTAASIDIDKLIEDHTALASSITETNQSMVASTGMLSGYGDSIQELAGRGDLTEEQIADLKIAVDGVNESCGKNYTVAKDAAGAWQVYADGAVVAKDAVLQVIDAQLAQIRAQATAENYKAVYQQMTADAEQLASAEADVAAKQDALNAKVAELTESGYDRYWTDASGNMHDFAEAEQAALDKSRENLSAVEQQAGATQSSLNRLEEQQKLAAMAAADGASALLKQVDSNAQLKAAIQGTGTDLVGFTRALDELGFSTETLANTEPAKIATIAKGWQGGTQEMIAACEAANIEVPEKLRQMGDQAAAETEQAGQAAGQGFTTGLSEQTQSAIDAALNTVDMTREEFDKLAVQAGIEGDEAALAFARQIAAGGTNAKLAGATDARSADDGLKSGDPASIGQGVVERYSGGIQASKTKAGNAASSVASSAGQGMQSQNLNASTWGHHLTTNFAGGISGSAAVGAVKSAVSTVLAATSGMHFSVPKEGIWSGAEKGGETSGRHLVENFVSGFQSAAWRLHDAVEAAMDDAADTMSDRTLTAHIAPSVSMPSISAPLDINWYATGGRIGGRSVLGLSPSGTAPTLQPASQQTTSQNTDIALLTEMVGLLASIKSDLPRIIAGNVPDSLKVDGREFGRLVRDVPR